MRNRIAFLYFETPFIVTLYNCHDSKLNLKNCIGDSINWFRSWVEITYIEISVKRLVSMFLSVLQVSKQLKHYGVFCLLKDFKEGSFSIWCKSRNFKQKFGQFSLKLSKRILADVQLAKGRTGGGGRPLLPAFENRN